MAIENEIILKQKDNTYLALLALSALSFFIFPLLGILVPFILWMIKIGQIGNIGRIAIRVILFEILCCSILYVTLVIKIMHWPFAGIMFTLIPVFYAINIAFITITAYRAFYNNNLSLANVSAHCELTSRLNYNQSELKSLHTVALFNVTTYNYYEKLSNISCCPFGVIIMWRPFGK